MRVLWRANNACMASRSPVAIRAISVASGMSRRALGSGAKRAQAAVTSTAAVLVWYMSISQRIAEINCRYPKNHERKTRQNFEH